MRSAAQYGVAERFLDNINFDITNGPWRRGGWVDAIVTDPPCELLWDLRADDRRCPCWCEEDWKVGWT